MGSFLARQKFTNEPTSSPSLESIKVHITSLGSFYFQIIIGHSSSEHSSSGHSSLGHSLSGHASPDTTDVDLSTPSRFVHPSLARTPRCSEAYLCWRSLVPSRADILPPCKRFRDSISLENSVKEDNDTYVLEDIKDDATAVEVTVDRYVEVEVDTGFDMEVDIRIDVEDGVEDEVESNDRGSMEVGVDMVAGIDIPDGMLMPNAMEYLE
uniref:Uncharacterized protein n=1 Tax=Tanacetum cinerariifolium TaxID=118510 RepID=A0A6L2JIU0_TANCI|nr:hypothetical protein [Tanacetum cinerariifolium]